MQRERIEVTLPADYTLPTEGVKVIIQTDDTEFSTFEIPIRARVTRSARGASRNPISTPRPTRQTGRVRSTRGSTAPTVTKPNVKAGGGEKKN